MVIAWHHFKLKVPDDWEPTAYSMEDRAGRLEFSNRHGFQGLIGWEPCKREPAMETMMAEFLRDHVPGVSSSRALTPRELETRMVDRWLMGWHDQALPCQAMTYLDEQDKLLRFVFASAGRDLIESTFVPVLASLEPNDGEIREYSLFGIRCFLPEDYRVEDMAAMPANVMIAFENRKKCRAIFRRWGMPELLLADKTLEQYYTGILGVHGCIVQSVESLKSGGDEVLRVSYSQRGEYQMDKFMGRKWTGGTAVCRYAVDEKRIYAFEQIGPQGYAALDSSEVCPAVNS